MAKVTWAVPLVQFGRCEIEFEGPEALQLYAEPENFGAQYADFVAGVMQGFEKRQQEIREGNKPDRVVEAMTENIATEEAAREMFEKELGPMTEIECKHNYRGTPQDGCDYCDYKAPAEDAPPWEQEAPKKSEPWKTDGPVKKPAKIEW